MPRKKTQGTYFFINRRRQKMECYSLKSIANTSDYMMIMQETDDGYVIRIIRDKDGYEDVTTDFISKELFETCVRTGYLKKIDSAKRLAVTA